LDKEEITYRNGEVEDMANKAVKLKLRRVKCPECGMRMQNNDWKMAEHFEKHDRVYSGDKPKRPMNWKKSRGLN